MSFRSEWSRTGLTVVGLERLRPIVCIRPRVREDRGPPNVECRCPFRHPTFGRLRRFAPGMTGNTEWAKHGRWQSSGGHELEPGSQLREPVGGGHGQMDSRRYRPARSNLTQLFGTAGLSATLGVAALAPATEDIIRWWNETPRVLVDTVPLSKEEEPRHAPGTFFQQAVPPTSSSGTESMVSMSTWAAYSMPEMPMAWGEAKLTEYLHADDYVRPFILKLRSA
jgi:hypothetical protein